MRTHRAVRVAAAAEASVRSCASRPRFLCANATFKGTAASAAKGGYGLRTRRYFSESRVLGGAAEAVYVAPFAVVFVRNFERDWKGIGRGTEIES